MKLFNTKLFVLCFIVVFFGAQLLSAQKPKTTESEKIIIAYANKSLTYYFYVVMEKALKRAVEAKGWQFISTNASFDNALQYDQFENYVLRGVGAIICNPIDSEGIIGAIQKANEKGIPVGIADTPTMGGDVAVTVAFDNYRGGYMVGQRIAELLKEKYGEPRGIVLNTYGALESYAWRLRKQGLDDAIGEYPKIKYLVRPTEGNVEVTFNATMNALAEYPNIDAVHAPSETMARAVYNALKEKGKLKPIGDPEHVIFVTIDGEPIAMKWIKEGYLDATVSQDAIAYSEITFEMIVKFAMQGKKVPLGEYENKNYYFEKAPIVNGMAGPEIIIPPYYIDKNNVEDKRHWGYIATEIWKIPYE